MYLTREDLVRVTVGSCEARGLGGPGDKAGKEDVVPGSDYSVEGRLESHRSICGGHLLRCTGRVAPVSSTDGPGSAVPHISIPVCLLCTAHCGICSCQD